MNRGSKSMIDISGLWNAGGEKKGNGTIKRRDIGRLEDMSQVSIQNPRNIGRAEALENSGVGVDNGNQGDD
jgi:hypothetical protein